MERLFHAILLVLNAYAPQVPAVCNDHGLAPERRAALCKPEPSIEPVGTGRPVPALCKEPYAHRLTRERRVALCEQQATVPIADVTFRDPRCEDGVYSTLSPAGRRIVDCTPKRVGEYPPLCQDYLTGEIAMPDDLRRRYCPGVPKVDVRGASLAILTRESIDALKAAATNGYYSGYQDGYDGCVERMSLMSSSGSSDE